MQKFDFTAPANGAPQVVNVPGRYMKYVTGNAGGNDAGLIITPGGKPGSKILLYPGQAITLPNDGTAGPGAWTIANATGQASISGTVVVGNGKIDDNTLTGVVQTIDGSKQRTLANTAFGAYASVPAGGASNYGRVQLWNPAGSGVRAVVEAVTVMAAAGSPINAMFMLFNGALATLSYPGTSKLPGVVQSKSSIYTDVVASSPVLASVLSALGAPGPGSNSFRFNEPIICPPGYGLTCWEATPNALVGCCFEWYEEPNV